MYSVHMEAAVREPTHRARRAGLSPSTVAQAALRLVDEAGADALTMRRLAEHLDVTPMALYNHVPSRRALLDAVADLVARQMQPPDTPAGSWQDELRRTANGIRAAYLDHPAAIGLVQTATATSPALEAPYRRVTAALTDAGFAADRADQAWSALVALVNGHVAYEQQGHLPGSAPDEAFAFALDALLAGLAALLDGGA